MPGSEHQAWLENQRAQKEAKRSKKKEQRSAAPAPADEPKRAEEPRSFDPNLGF
jgi:hypothetical protein